MRGVLEKVTNPGEDGHNLFDVVLATGRVLVMFPCAGAAHALVVSWLEPAHRLRAVEPVGHALVGCRNGVSNSARQCH